MREVHTMLSEGYAWIALACSMVLILLGLAWWNVGKTERGRARTVWRTLLAIFMVVVTLYGTEEPRVRLFRGALASGPEMRDYLARYQEAGSQIPVRCEVGEAAHDVRIVNVCPTPSYLALYRTAVEAVLTQRVKRGEVDTLMTRYNGIVWLGVARGESPEFAGRLIAAGDTTHS